MRTLVSCAVIFNPLPELELWGPGPREDLAEEGEVDHIEDGICIAPVRYAPGPSGSIDRCIVRSRWKGRCSVSSGWSSGTGEMSDPENDMADVGSRPAKELGLVERYEPGSGGSRLSEAMRECR